ncbi:MAG: SufE family protein [Alphaproteobacteria bacterium]|nr:SufE family protein [Alphaproteobacteria bacterium]
MNYEEMKKSLSLLESPIEKLEMVMDFGKKLKPIPEKAKCNEIFGCSSFVQICIDGDKFYGSADSAMVSGIVAIILAMVDGKTIEEIKNMDLLTEFNSLNLNFGASRLNGIQSIVRFFKNL